MDAPTNFRNFARMKPRKIELLAPARDAATAVAAFVHGADAVYIGASSHGARSAAANSLDDMARVVDEARKWDARVYATVNTLVYDSELKQVESLVTGLWRVGVDALIVQDMGLLRLDIPPIELHASTQCDIRDVATARFLADAGFARLVVARELSLEEIRAIHKEVPGVEIEAFVHGALCVSYSGDCHASFVATGRSANRGECAQICRLPYDLVDGAGNVIMAGKHLLSLRDMNRSAQVGDMVRAGVCSFKIEGRLKDAAYVKNTVAAYRRILDGVIDASDGALARASAGVSQVSFTPDLSRTFNRGYTSYFLTGTGKMACFGTPKSIGARVGVTTAASSGKSVTVRLTAILSNGDGLGWFDASGRFCGVRLNRVDGNRLLFAREVDIPAGTALYRNSDKAWRDLLDGNTAHRYHSAELTLRAASGSRLALDMALTGSGLSVSVATVADLQPACSPQEGRHRQALGKTGDTVYKIVKINDAIPDTFVPLSVLTALRRAATAAMDRALRLNHRRRLRQPEGTAMAPQGVNVANAKARAFYRDHGVASPQDALETSLSTERPAGELRVMTTRYCLRRELDACLRTAGRDKLPSRLFLRASGGAPLFRLDFDCSRCGMNVVMARSKN